jgi:hypothetical protein
VSYLGTTTYPIVTLPELVTDSLGYQPVDANTVTQLNTTTGNYANSAYAAANTADQKAVTSGVYANSAFATANSKTSNVGTVTSVGGTGTVNGLTLTGTITSNGNLTLGGTLDLSSPPTIGGATANTGTFSNLSYTGTLTGGTGVINIGSGQVYKDATGSVGIGTSSPSTKLDVVGNLFLSGQSTAEQFIRIGSGRTGNGYSYIDLQGDTTYNNGLRLIRGNIGSNSISAIESRGTGGLLFITQEAAAISFFTNALQRMQIGADGNILVGNNNNASNTLRFFDIYNTDTGASAGAIIRLVTNNAINSTTTTVDIVKYRTSGFLINNNDTASSNFTSFNVGASERMRIDSSGNFLVGTTGSPSGLTSPRVAAVTGNESAFYGVNNAVDSSYVVTLWNKATTGGRRMMRFNAGSSETEVGTIIFNGSSTVYATSSDYRLKDITGAVTGAEAKDFIMALQPKQGTWKSDGSKFVGFLAHELQAVSPSSVSGTKDAVDKNGNPEYQGIQAASSEVMANLIALIQEQQAMIEELRAEIQLLKTQ